MRASRAVVVAGGCAGILGAGWAVAPKELPSLDLVQPAATPAVDSSTPASSPTPSCLPLTDAEREAALAAIEAEEDAARDAARDAADAAVDAAKEMEDDDLADAADDAADAAEDAARDAADAAEAALADCVVVTPSPTASSPAEPAGDATTVDGPVITNLRGDYQARITVVGGVVTDVQAVVAGTSASESVSVNARAIPELRTRVLDAQTWDVDAVSGASFTSPAFIESLRGAFADAGL